MGRHAKPRQWRVRQFVSDRTHLALAVLLGLSGAATAGLTTTSRGDLDALLQRDWRGSYDLLVLPTGSGDFTSTYGFVEPNFITVGSTPRITDDQLRRIRQLDGIDVAAPIGNVGTVRILGVNPAVTVPPDTTGTFRMRVSITQSSGGVTQPVYIASGCLEVGKPAGRQPTQRTDLSLVRTTFHDVVGSETGISVFTPALPAPPATVLAVDPVAEKALLGGRAEVMTPLLAVRDAPRIAEGFPDKKIPDDFRFERDVVLSLSASGQVADRRRPVIPLIVLAASQAQTTLDAHFEALPSGSSQPKDDNALRDVCASNTFVPLGDTHSEVGGALRPFQRGQALIPWPGQGAPPDPGPLSLVAADLRPTVTGSASFVSAGTPSGVLDFTIEPRGIASLQPQGGAGPQSPTLAILGQERAYREVRIAPDTKVPAGQRQDTYFVPAPLGTVDLSSIVGGRSAAAYVPLGGYDPVPMRLAGQKQPMPVSLGGQGLVAGPPAAVTDLVGGRVLRGSSPIDAVRVRLREVTRFGPDSRTRIEKIASKIAELGLTVRVVAGSSLEQVTVRAPEYLGVEGGPVVSTASGVAGHTVSVHQEWTSLGAAVRVFDALTGVTKSLLAIALAVLGGLAAMSAMTRVPLRRTQVSALALHGWTRSNIRNLLLGEVGMACAVIGGMSLAGGLLAGFSQTQVVVTGAVIVGYLLFSVLTVRAVLRWKTRPAERPRTRIRTTRSQVAWAQIRPVAVPLLARTGAIAAASGCLAAATALIAAARRDAGTSRIAVAALSRLQPHQWILLAIVLVTAVLAGLLAGGLVQRGRSRTLHILRRLGWPRRHVARLIDLPFVLLLGPAVVLSMVVFRAIDRDSPTGATSLAPVILCLVLSAVIHVRDRQEST